MKSLSARFAVGRRAGERFVVTGALKATITQRCVVSLDEFDSDVVSSIDLVFVQPERPRMQKVSNSKYDGRHVPVPAVTAAPVPGSDDQVDPPDVIVDGTIDLGAIAVEFLTLARDPYPRKPGVRFDDVLVDGGREDLDVSPFAALERLKDRS